MPTMGNYCKAYLLKQFRAFPNWQESSTNVRPIAAEEQPDLEVIRTLTDEDVLFLQENYVVTDGVFQDEHIIFDNVTEDWKTFCHEQLGFVIPEYATAQTSTKS